MTPFPSRKQEKGFFARRNGSVPKKRTRAPKAVKASKRLKHPDPGAVLFRTWPHDAHQVRLAEDARRVDNRIYDLLDGQGRVGILGSEFQSLWKWWPRERRRQGRDPDEPQPNPKLANDMGYRDARDMILGRLDEGDSIQAAVYAHQVYCREGDLFTHEHGSDKDFLKGARRAYRELLRQHKAKVTTQPSAAKPKGADDA